MEMSQNNRKKGLGAFVLMLALLLTLFAVPADAQTRRRPSKTKNIAVGTAIGAVGGALIGGRKGALIGAGAGAGTGYMIYKGKKRRASRYR
jgi:osmotically inducible lipoprotein OsmB